MCASRIACVPLLLAAVWAGGGRCAAQEKNAELEVLRRMVAGLVEKDAEKQQQIDALRKEVERLKNAAPEGNGSPGAKGPSALDLALSKIEDAPGPAILKQPVEARVGGAALRLIDVSLDVLWAAGGSSEKDKSLETLQGGGHDPRKRGFTYPNVELSFAGAVDPYFNAEAHIVHFLDPLTGETVTELEEGYLTTTDMPFGLQIKAGQYLTEFGRVNPTHPHAWAWQDQPVIHTRVLGPDGMRAPGFRVGWLTPAPWFSELYFGVQNANGEQMSSFLANEEFFEERPVGGRSFVPRDVTGFGDLVYSMRWDNAWEVSKTVNARFGLSAAFGPNATGPHGRTSIFGMDFGLKWRPPDGKRTGRFLDWDTEFLYRHYRADPGIDSGEDPGDPADDIALGRDVLNDWGVVTQALYGFQPNWSAGLRLEYASGSGRSVGPYAGRGGDPFRDDRFRASPLVQWRLSEFSRVRFQYNYDRAEHLRHDDAHSFWVGWEFLIGAHPAHKY